MRTLTRFAGLRWSGSRRWTGLRCTSGCGVGQVPSSTSSFRWLSHAATLCLWCLLASGTSRAASTTLTWDAATGSSGYKVYQSTDTGPFLLLATSTNTSWTVVANSNFVTRWFVTATYPVPPYGAAESPPSNTVTNSPTTVPPAPNITLFAPTLGSTNVAQGGPLNIAAVCRNYGNADFALAAGSITLLAPGATRSDGPYVYALVLQPQTIASNASVTFSAVWTAPTNAALGTWTAYLAVQGSGGVWSGGPGTAFTVTATTPPPLQPLPPTNLRLTELGQRRRDVSWLAALDVSFNVDKAVENDPYARVATVAPGTLHWTDNKARQKLTHYRVQACNALCSTWSEVVYTP